nr:SDR family NAD(P)-dependent oxidoreductase [Candidatus Gracilibacteria bacterium]
MSNKILITGTNSGIGNYLAKKLLKNNKIIGSGRGENNIDGITYIKGDLNTIKTLQNIEESSDYFDYVIINAGVGYFDKFEKIGIKKHKETIETNLISPILLLQLLLEKNKVKKGIIFMGSIAGKKSLHYGSSYAASKFGLRGFAMQLKNELKGIKIQLINPSIVEKNIELRMQNNEITLKNNFEHFSNYKKTTLEDILEVVKNIINGNEDRFEIDL